MHSERRDGYEAQDWNVHYGRFLYSVLDGNVYSTDVGEVIEMAWKNIVLENILLNDSYWKGIEKGQDEIVEDDDYYEEEEEEDGEEDS